MFDIRIGTLIPALCAEKMIPQLNPMGFETYALDFNNTRPAEMNLESLAKNIRAAAGERKISCLGYYGNPILNRSDRENLASLIRNARAFGCRVIGTFAGGDPALSVPDNIPGFHKVFSELARIADGEGVKIGFEGCGGGWNKGCTNIGFIPDSWEMMFDAVPSSALGLEWEPCHALEGLADPEDQLEQWAHKVVHVHGKDATVAWHVIRRYGIKSPHPYCWNRTPGFGDSNWSNLFTILLRHGFEGSCDIEGYHDPVHYDDMEWTAQVTSLEYLKRCRGGISYFEGPAEYRGYQGRRK